MKEKKNNPQESNQCRAKNPLILSSKILPLNKLSLSRLSYELTWSAEFSFVGLWVMRKVTN
jgi:hypothetical protein